MSCGRDNKCFHGRLLVDTLYKGLLLQEERKLTGRYVAGGATIFVCLLGIYELIARGIPEYAALFAPAVIMIIYVVWILNSTRQQHKVSV